MPTQLSAQTATPTLTPTTTPSPTATIKVTTTVTPTTVTLPDAGVGSPTYMMVLGGFTFILTSGYLFAKAYKKS